MTFESENFDDVTQTLKIVTLVTLFILWGLLTPICLVYGFRFWVFRQCQVLKKRYSFIACIEILFVLIGFFTNGCIIISDSLQSVWLRQLSFHITIFVQYCIIYCWLWRFWLIYYDMKWMVASLNTQWKRLINPRSRSKSYSPRPNGMTWFLDHKNTFGNRAWVGTRIGVFVVFASLLAIIVRYICDFTEDEPIGETIYLFFYFVPFVVLGILRCKLPDFTDSIYIKQEMKYIMLVLIIILIAFGIQEVAEYTFRHTKNTQLTINILFYVAIELCNFLCILITTRYVLRKVSILLHEQQKQAAGADKRASKKPGKSTKDANVNYVQLKGDDNDQLQRQNSSQMNLKLSGELYQCLSNEKSFDLFMRFLAKEFSIECLLSFVEMIQFKQYMAKRMGSKMNDDEEKEDDTNGGTGGSFRRDTDLDIVFPDSVPTSDIIYNDEGDVSIKAKIYKFYLKYIRINSEFEINILDSTRRGIIEKMKDYHGWMNDTYYDEVGLYHFYDGCIHEMKLLLIASFKRFKEYHKDDLLEIFADSIVP